MPAKTMREKIDSWWEHNGMMVVLVAIALLGFVLWMWYQSGFKRPSWPTRTREPVEETDPELVRLREELSQLQTQVASTTNANANLAREADTARRALTIVSQERADVEARRAAAVAEAEAIRAAQSNVVAQAIDEALRRADVEAEKRLAEEETDADLMRLRAENEELLKSVSVLTEHADADLMRRIIRRSEEGWASKEDFRKSAIPVFSLSAPQNDPQLGRIIFPNWDEDILILVDEGEPLPRLTFEPGVELPPGYVPMAHPGMRHAASGKNALVFIHRDLNLN